MQSNACSPLRTGPRSRFPASSPARPTIWAQALRHAAKAVEAIGLKPSFVFPNGGLDANWLDKHGVPTATISAGQDKHQTLNDCLHLPEFLQGCPLAIERATLSLGTRTPVRHRGLSEHKIAGPVGSRFRHLQYGLADALPA